MNGEQRREQILQRLLSANHQAISGSNLAKQMHVSRQVIVQDIALLRANGHEIISTTSGYLLYPIQPCIKRVVKLYHSEAETERELNLIVDLGGSVEDIFIYHKVYGTVRAPLHITSRKDVQTYLKELQNGKSVSLMQATSGYHYHTICAKDEASLQLIFDTLSKEGFLAQLQDYEPIDFWNAPNATLS